MAVTNRWAIRDVAVASFFDLVTGKLKVKTDSLKVSGLENTSSVVYAMGGSGNPRLVGFSGSREAKFTLQDALFTNEMIGMLLGNDVVSAATPVTRNEELVVNTNAAALSFTPVASGALISVNKLNFDGTIGESLDYASSAPSDGEYSVSGKSVTFSAGEITDGNKVIVYYETMGSTDAKQIKATTDKFAGSYKLILDVLVRDYFTKKDFAAQIVVPNAKIEDNWNLSMAPENDPSVLDIPMEALKSPDSTDLYIMTIYDEEDLA